MGRGEYKLRPTVQPEERLTPHVFLGMVSPQIFRMRSLVRLSCALRGGSGAACNRLGRCVTVMFGASLPARKRATDRSEKCGSIRHGCRPCSDADRSVAPPPGRLQERSVENRAEVGNEEPNASGRVKRNCNEKDIPRKKYLASRENQSALPLSLNGRAQLRLRRSAFAIRRS